MTVYVSREVNIITGVFARIQPGLAEEAIEDSDPAVVAFLTAASPDNAPTKVALRQAATQAVADINSYLTIADTATPAQVRTAVKGLAQDMKLIIQYLMN